MSIINKVICLKLNAAWQPIGCSTVAKAIVDLAAGISAKALDLDYEKDENGNYILDEFGSPINDSIFINPVDWDTWLTLPIRSFDEVIHYGNGLKVMRVPTIIIAKNFHRMPYKTFKGKPSKDAIYIRDNGIDQYTGRKLKRDESTIDHVIPQSRGGTNAWENLALTCKEINSKKGNRFNHEVGLTLLKEPKAPRSVPISALIREIKRFEWKRFLPHLIKN